MNQGADWIEKEPLPAPRLNLTTGEFRITGIQLGGHVGKRRLFALSSFRLRQDFAGTGRRGTQIMAPGGRLMSENDPSSLKLRRTGRSWGISVGF